MLTGCKYKSFVADEANGTNETNKTNETNEADKTKGAPE